MQDSSNIQELNSMKLPMIGIGMALSREIHKIMNKYYHRFKKAKNLLFWN